MRPFATTRAMPRLLLVAVLLAATVAGCKCDAGKAAPVPLFGVAATSLTDVLPKVASAWQVKGNPGAAFTFDATSRIAALLESGSPADLFFSADERWMGELDRKGLLVHETRCELGENSLVLVVSRDAKELPTSPRDLAELGSVRHLAMSGEEVPSGRYAQAALTAMQLWTPLEPKVVRADNVRATLEWVARGEAEAGIVFLTDAQVEPRVKVAFTFPRDSHPRIVVTAAVLAASTRQEEARSFLRFALGEGQTLFRDAGFLSTSVRE